MSPACESRREPGTLGRYDETDDLLVESEQRNAEAGDKIGRAFNLKHRGEILKARGDFEKGQDLIREGKALLIEAGNQEYLPEYDTALARGVQLTLEFNETADDH